MTGCGQASTPVTDSPLPLGLASVSSAPVKTSSLPSAPPPTSFSAATEFEVCSVSDPVCLMTQESSATTVHTPSSQRKFVVADVAEEQDSPDELSTQASTESLPQGEQTPQQPGGSHDNHVTQVEASTVSHHVGESSGSSLEEVTVVSAVPEDPATSRPPLLSAPSFFSALDSTLTSRQRSTSLPHKLSSLPSSSSPVSTMTTTTTTSERLGGAPPTMPAIPERSLTSESDVFPAEATHKTSGSVSSNSSSQTSNHQHTSESQPPHPVDRKPHPPSCSDPSPSPHPHAPPTMIPFQISQQHSEVLSTAFMSFIFSMSHILRDPAIQPLINHLEHHYRGAHSSSNVASPPSPPAPHTQCSSRDERKDEDDDLRRKIEE